MGSPVDPTMWHLTGDLTALTTFVIFSIYIYSHSHTKAFPKKKKLKASHFSSSKYGNDNKSAGHKQGRQVAWRPLLLLFPHFIQKIWFGFVVNGVDWSTAVD